MARRSELALTAALFLLPLVAVLGRCVADGSLFALHPALNALAMLVCLPAAMLLRKDEKVHAKRVWLTKLHLLLNLAAGLLVTAAGGAAFIAKRDAGQQHFATPHSWAALVTGMFFALNVFQGLLLTFEGVKANWQWKDETHVLTGMLVYVGGVATMLYGLHTSHWGAKNFSPERQFQLTVLIIAAHVTLLGKSLVLQRRESQARMQKAAKAHRRNPLLITMAKKLELLVLSGLLGAPCATILAKCAAAPSLFAVHPAANAVAFLLCFPLGIYVMLERKTVADFKTRVFLSKLHMISQVLAMLLLSVGGAAAYMTKNAYGKEHFTSTHSWLAGVTATLSTLNMLGGLATTFGGKKTSWQWKNPGHRIGGTLAFLGGGCSVILGVYSGGWGISQLGEELQFKVAGSVAAAYSLLLFKIVATSSVSTSAEKSD
ncbi:hypothetical protein PHYSODRAFT_565717 [Phytophthora sojae]|uniref:Cytochrome b561 domain-containing protein n=1 Tax=Phytophthora sojae (strain P6497) TaxID=1094619 RepID=G5ABL0_PHYSP|nr:hypothetical protein PHYSODRAFT_565717 [Phytophthora sojae]EGZ06735.1 hypothetical protein PHYSODRAFT_565717 [Phytophthora sojae]|eukprot:XP_009537499.1 hypothetical protein PHYSODRAFT_565717 [Phytophthora sojae]